MSVLCFRTVIDSRCLGEAVDIRVVMQSPTLGRKGSVAAGNASERILTGIGMNWCDAVAPALLPRLRPVPWAAANVHVKRETYQQNRGYQQDPIDVASI